MSGENENLPDVSIIVPAYNAAKTIKVCVDSIFKITEYRIETIVVDDGSFDGTLEILGNVPIPENHSLVVKSTSNKGVSSARNSGLDIARGNVVAFVDSDDTIRPNPFMELLSKFFASQCDVAVGGVCICYVDGHREYRQVSSQFCNSVVTGEKTFMNLMESESFTPLVFAYLWRRDCIIRNNLRFHYRMSEDDLWTTEALCMASKVMLTDIVHYNYIKREQSITASNVASVLRIASHDAVAMHLFQFLTTSNLSVATKGWIACKILYLLCDVLKTARLLALRRDVSLKLCYRLKSYIVESNNLQIKRIGFLYLVRIQELVKQ